MVKISIKPTFSPAVSGTATNPNRARVTDTLYHIHTHIYTHTHTHTHIHTLHTHIHTHIYTHTHTHTH
jgi:hypothetical protein